MDNFIPISCVSWSEDCSMFEDIINQGIDARLTAFTKSTFAYVKHRLEMDFHKDEIEILMRRLSERADYNNNADEWENDILYILYGVEII